MKIEKVIIIGAGPAGIAAGIQLKRYGIDPVIFEKRKIGGLLNNANLVENYPGFPDGITGKKLVSLLEAQAGIHSLNIIANKVDFVEYHDNYFEIILGDEFLKSEYLIVASGTKPNKSTELQISADISDKIDYEIDGFRDIKNKKVVIVGGGDAAFDYALGFHSSNKVKIINRGEDTCCLKLLKARADKSGNISYKGNTFIKAISRHENELAVNCKNHNETYDIKADFLIFAIGREPSLDFLSEDLKNKTAKLEDMGLLYFAGDVQNGLFRQTAIAVGDGTKAAMKIYARLKETV